MTNTKRWERGGCLGWIAFAIGAFVVINIAPFAAQVHGRFAPYVWSMETIQTRGVHIRISFLHKHECRNAAFLILENKGALPVTWGYGYQATTLLVPGERQAFQNSEVTLCPRLTFIDVEGKHLLWRGVAPDDLSERRTYKRLVEWEASP